MFTPRRTTSRTSPGLLSQTLRHHWRDRPGLRAWCWLGLWCSLWLWGGSVTAAPPPDGNPRTAYFTVGDAQDLLEFPPLDSEASIAAAFDSLKNQYAVERIWWRGGQDEIWGEEFLIRPENRGFAAIWEWWRDLQYRRVGTNRLAVAQARQRGLQIWMAYGLFDLGSQADAGYSGFPYAVEDRLRVEHPEWAPVNRWGTARQGGPLELAYPAAREAFASQLAKYLVAGGYQGIAFLTYAENFSQRYEDEFGYAEPVVAEFQKRHGVDIRTQAFDRQAWRQLRGEHVTAFLRLLKQKLAPHAIRIAVCVDGQQPDQAMRWTVDGGVRTAGNWSWSVPEWLRGGVVDELCLFNPPDEAIRRRLLEQSRQAGAGVVISAFMTRGPLEPGVPRVMFLGREIECGHPNEAWIDWPDEQVQLEPASRLEEPDVLARRRLLTGALKGKVALSDAALVKGVADPDLYVRRLALRTLAKSPRPGTQPALVAALRDQETTVRCLAALALAELPDAGVVATLVDAALANPGLHQFAYRAVTDALKKRNSDNRLTMADKQELVTRLGTTTAAGQALLLHYFTLVGAPATPEVEQRLSQLLVSSPSAEVRELSLVNLKSSFGATATVRELVRKRMDEELDAAVQVRAAVAYAQMHARMPAEEPLRKEALATLEQFFRRYGAKCERADREWGWRLLGNTLLECGPEGRQVLERLLATPEDRELADRAWRVLYLRQGDQFFPTTPAADAEAHRRHPWRKFVVAEEPAK